MSFSQGRNNLIVLLSSLSCGLSSSLTSTTLQTKAASGHIELQTISFIFDWLGVYLNSCGRLLSIVLASLAASKRSWWVLNRQFLLIALVAIMIILQPAQHLFYSS